MPSRPSLAHILGAALVVAAACGPTPLGATASAPARSRPPPVARSAPAPAACARAPFLTPFDGRLVLRSAYRAASSEFRFCPRYSGFGPVRGGRFHGGVDLSATTGTPLRAAVDGTLSYARDPDGYGLYARLAFVESKRKGQSQSQSQQCDRGEELEIVYGHLIDDDPDLELAPRPIRAGEFVGRVGCSGNARGMCSPSPESHVHVTLKRAGRARLEPLSVLGWNVAMPSDEDRPAGWHGCIL